MADFLDNKNDRAFISGGTGLVEVGTVHPDRGPVISGLMPAALGLKLLLSLPTF